MPKEKYQKLIIPLIILLFLWQGFWLVLGAKNDSQTTDEGVHLSAGYTYLTRFDYRFNPEHPPLAKYLAALPLLFIKPQVPSDSFYWEKAANYYSDNYNFNNRFGQDFLYRAGNLADQLLFWGRVPIIFITFSLGLSVFLISRRLFGLPGGMISLLFFSFSPNILAHGHLITTDIIASLFFLLAIWSFALFLEKPISKKLILSGLVLGLAELSKFTLITLYPIFILLFILFNYQQLIKLRFRQLGKPFAQLILIFFISWMVIWAGYGFKIERPPKYNGDQNLISSEIEGEMIKPMPLAKTPLINEYFSIPRDYFKGLSMVLVHTNAGHDSYLLGQRSNTGWWYYFPVMFLLKTPLPTLMIFFLSIASLLIIRKKDFKITALLFGALVYFTFSIFSKTNLGVRHILPFYAVLFVSLGSIITTDSFFRRWKYWKAFLAIFILWLMIDFSLIAPRFLTYYNQLAGGTMNGYKIAADSNLDWGQDIYRLKDYLDKKGIEKPYINYDWSGRYSLRYYGVSYRPIPADREVKELKGFIILGATALNQERFSFLKDLTPYDRIGSALFVYNLE